jgi:hypothetical protein
MAFTPLIYPTLNLAFSVIKRPITAAGVTQAASGRETRVSYWTFPMWEWDLTYDYLPDDSGGWQAGKTASDIKTLMGLYGQVGMLTPFLFTDDDDNQAYHSGIAIADGAATWFTITRAYGAGGFFTAEPVGYVNSGHPVNVYFDGALQDPATWSIDYTLPYSQRLTFTTAPPSGVLITMDFYYYYVVRFKDNSLEFEKIYNRLWSIKRATLMSLKGA